MKSTKHHAIHSVPDESDDTWDLIDLFSGCGGASAGFLASGRFAHLYAADTDAWAAATYRRNLGHAPEQIDLGTLANGSHVDAWAARVRPNRDAPAVVIGCAPCQGFSSHVKMK